MLNETTRIGFKSLGSLGTIPILILEKKINNGLTNPFSLHFSSPTYTPKTLVNHQLSCLELRSGRFNVRLGGADRWRERGGQFHQQTSTCLKIRLMATRNPVNSPVEVGSCIPLFTRFGIHARWLFVISSINSIWSKVCFPKNDGLNWKRHMMLMLIQPQDIFGYV